MDRVVRAGITLTTEEGDARERNVVFSIVFADSVLAAMNQLKFPTLLVGLLLAELEPACRGESPPSYQGKPFSDAAHQAGAPTIPGIVQCALYDLGGRRRVVRLHRGRYRIKLPYTYQANVVTFDPNGKPAATCKIPIATQSPHHWNFCDIGTITFPEAGLQLLTFHYGRGNNLAYFEFEKAEPSGMRN